MNNILFYFSYRAERLDVDELPEWWLAIECAVASGASTSLQENKTLDDVTIITMTACGHVPSPRADPYKKL